MVPTSKDYYYIIINGHNRKYIELKIEQKFEELNSKMEEKLQDQLNLIKELLKTRCHEVW